ncbi:caudovirus prohead protease [Flavobacterium cerinum]|uniref:Caudovirus prohead protease n=1 Tax=Flavobacterium cerinum TaxID=2502784 RepID=A0A444HC08_9FLAO|nr:caudovirus prohead protease [Flavobacterium cerinum]RWX00923.1 caudovirus prohead protease [Flavobacterium cerinum]
MAKSNKPFILNDENVENSYGFFVSTEGINLSRFEKNPVMLSNHRNGNEFVLGRWLDLKKENGLLSGYPEFDSDDVDAAKIEGKVERGFIKGASMGLLFSHEDMVYLGGKIWLKESELVEGTIIPVPSNPNALQLYLKGKEDTPLTEAEVKSLCLSLAAEPTPELNLTNNMKKIMLSLAAFLALGFKDVPKEGVDESEIENKIMGLSAELSTTKTELENLKKENETLKTEKETASLSEGKVFLLSMVTAGKIKADQVEAYLGMYKTNPELVKATIEAIPAKTELGATVATGGTATDAEIKTLDDFQKAPTATQLAFKANKPEEYKKLFK